MSDHTSNPNFEVELLFDQPYASRQLIQFAEEAVPPGERRRNDSDSDDEVTAIGIEGRFFEFWWHVPDAASAVIREALEVGSGVVPIPWSTATDLSLPPGHPRKNVLYVAHPSDPQTYLPMADFHRLVFEHKFAEVVRLLMHLGAETIDVRHQRGWDQGFAAEISAGIPHVGLEGETGASKESSSDSRVLYQAELAGHDDPDLPDNLVWFPHEPTWQSVAEGRREFGLQQFSLKLQYTDDYGVNADLAVEAQNAGFSLGGAFEKHQTTVWSIEGTFG